MGETDDEENEPRSGVLVRFAVDKNRRGWVFLIRRRERILYVMMLTFSSLDDDNSGNFLK